MEIDRTIFHPDYKQEPYWWEAARPGTKFAVDLPKEMEIFIIGSGYSGLSAALELAREGRDVSVVDALAFGEAASSRNGGGVSAGVNIGKGISGGPGQANRSEGLLNGLLSESAAAFEFVRTLIDREGIECHFEKRGRFVGAVTPEHFEGMKKKAGSLNQAIQVDAKIVPKSEQRREIGSDFYHGGMTIERAGKLHPALYHKGLLDACHRAGVKLTAHCKVERIDGSVGKFRLQTEKGECKAEKVIVATNGYTSNLTPKLRRRIVPISSQIIATEELPEDVARELIPNGRTISESPRVTSYYRLLPGDRRVMYGGRARFENVHPDVSAALLYQMMTDRWPQLNGVRITHSWSGFVAMTVDALPHMGQEDGLHYCTGCNGSGVAMMTYLGRQVARRILQDSQSVSAYESFELPKVPVPFYSGNPWFLPIIGNYYRYLDSRERRRAGL
ncbi:MAG: FAD-binding oxidoreductase [Pseudomonadota bacterium]|nr:FAD-binding oxidoreductase [Pseudomonadota bacterium]